MMEKGAGQLLMLLLLAIGLHHHVHASHDPNFCTITPNTGESLPAAPKQFSLTSTSKDGQSIVTAVEFFDGLTGKSAYYIGSSDFRFQVILNSITKQAMVINSRANKLMNRCSVQDVKDDELLIGVEVIPGIPISIPSKFFFFGQGNEGIENQGSAEVDKIKAIKFYSCYYLAAMDTSMKIYWYYKDDPLGKTPLRIEIETQNNQDKKISSSIIDISSYYPNNSSFVNRNPFIAPDGIYCPNLNTGNVKPERLPERFSMRVEDIREGVAPTYMKEVYDFPKNLTMLIGYPGDAGKYGEGRLMIIHDFRRLQSYTINQDLGRCTLETLSKEDWDSNKDIQQVRMKNPAELFDFDTENVQYKGRTRYRGMDTDVFISWKKWDIGGGVSYDMTTEINMAKMTYRDAATNTDVVVSTPISIHVTSDASFLNSHLHIFDFQLGETDFHRHDIGLCFNDKDKKHFALNFPLSSVDAAQELKRSPYQFISVVTTFLSGILDVSPMRILDPELDVHSNAAVLMLTITERPDPSSSKAGTPLSEIEAQLQARVAKGDVLALYQNAKGDIITASADRVTTLERRDAGIAVGGYTAGALIGLGLAMAIVGLALGVGIIFAIYKARGSSLDSLDPFKPQRMA